MIHIKKSNFLYGCLLIILLFIIIEPEMFVNSSFHKLIKYFQDVILLIVTILYLKVKKNIFSVLVILLNIWMLVTTWTNEGSFSNVIYSIIPTVTLVIVLDLFRRLNSRITLFCVTLYFNAIVYLNSVLCIFNPEGVRQVISATTQMERGINFLGVANQTGPFLVIAIVTTGMYCYNYGKNKIWFIGAFVHGIISFIWLTSTTTLLGIVGYAALLIILYNKKYNFIKLVPSIYLGGIVLVNVGVVIFKIQEKMQYFIYIILKKDVTLSTRTDIWEIAIEKIKQAFFCGYGGIEAGRYIQIGTWKFSAHNLLLELFLLGGAIAVAILLILIWISIRKMYCCKDKKVQYIIFPSIFIIYFMQVTEFYPYLLNIVLLYIIYHCNDFLMEGQDNAIT